MKQIPLALVGLRVLIALILLVDGFDRKTGSFFVIAFLVAFFSDIFDGVLARQWGVSDAKLRQWDSSTPNP